MEATLDKPAWLAAVQNIDGWLSVREATALYDLARATAGPIIEIGSYWGRSTAALALGAMAGQGAELFAIDSFIGVPPVDRQTEHGARPGWKGSSPSQLLENLTAAGVRGKVTIVAKASADAANDVPDECGLLFIDGGHQYEEVLVDMQLYLPKVAPGGMVVLHDCWDCDPGVVQAVDELMMTQPDQWRLLRRVDSAVVFQRRATVRRKIFLAFPGPNLLFGAAKGLMTASLGAHEVAIYNAGRGWDDMNALWVDALNNAERGGCTHFAMLHSDILPDPGWLDTLMCELDDTGADLVSAVAPLKDTRGLTSAGIGDAENPWAPFRRFTMRELMEMPETFSIADTPHTDRYLLHNTGCWACDLRSPLFYAEDEHRCLHAFFNFPLRARRHADGHLVHERESEDWFFSRKLAELGARTLITRKVGLKHVGSMEFGNTEPWGSYRNGDQDTRSNWDPTFTPKP